MTHMDAETCHSPAHPLDQVAKSQAVFMYPFLFKGNGQIFNTKLILCCHACHLCHVVWALAQICAFLQLVNMHTCMLPLQPSPHAHTVFSNRTTAARHDGSPETLHPCLALQGPTSSGKTSLVAYLAAQTGHKLVRINNHEQTDLQEYLGSYISNETGKLVFREGALVQAVRQGHWLLLDELNLAPSQVLEALNRCATANGDVQCFCTALTFMACCCDA